MSNKEIERKICDALFRANLPNGHYMVKVDVTNEDIRVELTNNKDNGK